VVRSGAADPGGSSAEGEVVYDRQLVSKGSVPGDVTMSKEVVCMAHTDERSEGKAGVVRARAKEAMR
jgi:hypothetical protein